MVEDELSMWGKGFLWPVPPVVNQMTAVNPDGSVDPDAYDDCGESCVTSAVMALSGVTLSPGCIRESMGSRAPSGLTTAVDLQWFIQRIGGRAEVFSWPAPHAWEMLHLDRKHGRYHIVLGVWNGPEQMHWRLHYGQHPTLGWAMDPGLGRYVNISRLSFEVLYRGSLVVLS